MGDATVAVIGAGLAGLACARALHAAGVTVRVLEKGRAPGGRIATRRTEFGSFDHGAQYFTVRSTAFAAHVNRGEASGAVARWMPRWPGGEQEGADLWVGTPGMSALPAQLADGLALSTGTRVTRLERAGHRWIVRGEQDAALGQFEFVVLAMPAPQALLLARDHSPVAGRLGHVAMAPCWAAMIAFERPVDVALDADWTDDPVLPWIARNSAKPGRAGVDTWVLHASEAYSRAELESEPARVRAALVDALARRLSTALPAVVHGDVHRWRHARVTTTAGEPFVADWERGLAMCGDWCIDARIEAAFESGDLLGRELAPRLRAVQPA
jgi:hypothetical protein